MRGWRGATVTSTGRAGSIVKAGVACRTYRGGAPVADQYLAAPLCARRPAALAQAGIEADDGPHRSAGSAETADHQGGGQQAVAQLVHHRFAECQPAPAGLPGRLQRRRVGPIPARGQLARPGRSHLERAGLCSADQPGEEGSAVEAGDAHPLDGALRGHQGGGAGVPDQAVVADPPGMSKSRWGKRHRGGPGWGRSRPTVGSWRLRGVAVSTSTGLDQQAEGGAVGEVGDHGDERCPGAVVEASRSGGSKAALERGPPGWRRCGDGRRAAAGPRR